MDAPKVLAFAVLSVGSTAVFLLVRGRSWQESFFKRAVVAAVLVKVSACVLVYTLWPSLIQNSDARNFYLPQTLALLSGQLPNRDFASSYSVLFLPLLALPVKLWPSAGSIVLTMLAAETGMLALYLRFCGRGNRSGGWGVAFLYAWSPFSLYWVALSGHNGVLIALWVMLALILAQRGRDWVSGVVAGTALLTTKLLAVLAWPALALYRRGGGVRRMAPMAVSVVLVTLLTVFGMDFVAAMRHELASRTSGNVWLLVHWMSGGAGPATTPVQLPVVAFALVFIPMCVAYVRSDRGGGGFDRAAAFVAATNLLFLVLSRKAFSYYLVMTLIFVIHAVVADERRLVPHLTVLAFLGAVGSVEEIHTSNDVLLLSLGVVRIASYVYLLVVCFRLSIRGVTTASHAWLRE